MCVHVRAIAAHRERGREGGERESRERELLPHIERGRESRERERAIAAQREGERET